MLTVRMAKTREVKKANEKILLVAVRFFHFAYGQLESSPCWVEVNVICPSFDKTK